MKLTKEQKTKEKIVQSVDVELNEEQLEIVAGGSIDPTTFKPITTFDPTPTIPPNVS